MVGGKDAPPQGKLTSVLLFRICGQNYKIFDALIFSAIVVGQKLKIHKTENCLDRKAHPPRES